MNYKKCVQADGDKVTFRVKPSTKIEKVRLQHYCSIGSVWKCWCIRVHQGHIIFVDYHRFLFEKGAGQEFSKVWLCAVVVA